MVVGVPFMCFLNLNIRKLDFMSSIFVQNAQKKIFKRAYRYVGRTIYVFGLFGNNVYGKHNHLR